MHFIVLTSGFTMYLGTFYGDTMACFVDNNV